MPTFTATTNTDTLTGSAGDDSFVFGAGTATAGDTVTGDAGTDTLVVNGNLDNFDFTSVSLSSVEAISFGAASSGSQLRVFFNASQFGAGLSNSLLVTTSDSVVSSYLANIQVTLTSAGAFSAAGWAFTPVSTSVNRLVVIVGSSGADTLTAATIRTELQGGAGADVLNAGPAGNDRIDGGDGDDMIFARPGGFTGDVIIGGLGFDTVSYANALSGVVTGIGFSVGATDGITEVEMIVGSAFIDNITNITSSPSTLDGAGGDDTILGGFGADELRGGAGNDTLNARDGVDTLIGGDGDDFLDGGAGNDTLHGGPGNDTLIHDAGDVIVENPGEGTDLVRTSLASFTLGVTAGSANVESVQYTGSSNFVGIGGPLAGSITGNSGNDTLISSQAGGALDGGFGNDVLWFYGSTTLQGGPGFDHAIQLDQSGQNRSLGLADIEVYVANAGNDTLSFAGAGNPTIAYGGAGIDTVTLGAAGGYAFGQDGNDTLNGGDGGDNLLGNAGVDTLNGGQGNDVLYIDVADGLNFNGGAGADYAILEGTGAINIALAGRSVEVFVSNAGNDTIDASGVSVGMGLYGSGGDDVITGAAASSQLFGQDGNDTLNAGAVNDVVLGGNGADLLFGNAGDDLLIGEAGDDTIAGGLGADILWGDANGVGADTFRFVSGDVQAGVRDQINDFGDAAGNQDVIQFSGIAQNQVTIANDGAGNVLLTIAATGGTYSILVIGMTAAAIQDDLVFGP